MTIGEVVDYVYEYNEIHKAEGDGKSGSERRGDTRRKATQADWDQFWG